MTRDVRIEGIGTLPGGEYGSVAIEGMARCEGDLKGVSLVIDGMFKVFGSVSAESFQCDGMAEVRGGLRAGKLDIEGVLTVRDGGAVEAGEIRCEGIIRGQGEISADRIEAEGIILADQIVGDRIVIRSRTLRRFLPFLRPSRSRIRLIEATEVDLRGVSADTVNGQNVVIREGCRIGALDCSGRLSVHPDSRIDLITGAFVREDG